VSYHCPCGNVVEIPRDMQPLVDAAGVPMCNACFERWRQDNPPPPPQAVPVRASQYAYTADMQEISGFGGGYEQTCRNMVIAGLEWLDAHPDAEPQFKGFKNIYGVICDENDDAKALSKVVVDAAEGDCTGAMHQASIGHILFAHKHGWQRYCDEMRKKDKDNA
jgi:hypothetical protein